MGDVHLSNLMFPILNEVFDKTSTSMSLAMFGGKPKIVLTIHISGVFQTILPPLKPAAAQQHVDHWIAASFQLAV